MSIQQRRHFIRFAHAVVRPLESAVCDVIDAVRCWQPHPCDVLLTTSEIDCQLLIVCTAWIILTLRQKALRPRPQQQLLARRVSEDLERRTLCLLVVIFHEVVPHSNRPVHTRIISWIDMLQHPSIAENALLHRALVPNPCLKWGELQDTVFADAAHGRREAGGKLAQHGEQGNVLQADVQVEEWIRRRHASEHGVLQIEHVHAQVVKRAGVSNFVLRQLDLHREDERIVACKVERVHDFALHHERELCEQPFTLRARGLGALHVMRELAHGELAVASDHLQEDVEVRAVEVVLDVSCQLVVEVRQVGAHVAQAEAAQAFAVRLAREMHAVQLLEVFVYGAVFAREHVDVKTVLHALHRLQEAAEFDVVSLAVAATLTFPSNARVLVVCEGGAWLLIAVDIHPPQLEHRVLHLVDNAVHYPVFAVDKMLAVARAPETLGVVQMGIVPHSVCAFHAVVKFLDIV